MVPLVTCEKETHDPLGICLELCLEQAACQYTVAHSIRVSNLSRVGAYLHSRVLYVLTILHVKPTTHN